MVNVKLCILKGKYLFSTLESIQLKNMLATSAPPQHSHKIKRYRTLFSGTYIFYYDIN